MKSALAFAVLAVLAVHVSAECSNMCSGHGVCGTSDMCRCYRNWRGADCSERSCQFARSFVDTAQGDLNHDGRVEFATNDYDFDGMYGTGSALQNADGGTSTYKEMFTTGTTGAALNHPVWNQNTQAFVTVRTQWRASTFELFPPSTRYRALNHVYMECSNKGSCDRETGECACYAGYEGSACQRSVCPNACSGHGVCRNIRDITQGYTNNANTGTLGNYTYQLWDAEKIQACVCDPGYSGVDCSQRLCPMGDDPLSPSEQGQVDSIVEVEIAHAGTAGADGDVDTFAGSFRFQFVDSFGEEWTSAEVSGVTAHKSTNTDAQRAAATTVAAVEAALLGLPNSVIPSVTVSTAGSTTDKKGRKFAITFTGNPGNQLSKLSVTDSSLQWASSGDITVGITTPQSNVVYKTNTECSSRGLCDYETGVCQCFRGYRLADCSGQSALAF